ncbi:MAG TPA: shikimate dehydrogenase [Acidimicrobiales bacterium]|nr:shikimate dehydrogenase [Acidimicrobiales bacterium]
MTISTGIIGYPIAHSLSPVIHRAAFDAVGIDGTFEIIEVPEGGAAQAIEAARARGMRGLSVTFPHKEAAVASTNELAAHARMLGAVNTLVFDGATTRGDNTDGAGFVNGLRDDAGVDPAGMRCLVVGAGGAARAVVLALGAAGAAEVAVLNRTHDRAVAAAALAGDAGRVAVGPGEALAAELIVNATTIGMDGGGGAGELPLSPEVLRGGQIVVDLVYHPLQTAFLRAAEAAGATPVTGIPMLVHQAAVQFEIFTGEAPAVAPMRAAALAALSA